jgi:hypothetical protein
VVHAERPGVFPYFSAFSRIAGPSRDERSVGTTPGRRGVALEDGHPGISVFGTDYAISCMAVFTDEREARLPPFEAIAIPLHRLWV